MLAITRTNKLAKERMSFEKRSIYKDEYNLFPTNTVRRLTICASRGIICFASGTNQRRTSLSKRPLGVSDHDRFE